MPITTLPDRSPPTATGPSPGPPAQALPDHRDERTIAGTSRAVDLVLFPARAFLAFGWLRAGIEKAIAADWWAGTDLAAFIDEQRDATLPFFQPLVDALVVPAPMVTASLVVVAEIIIGLLLITGRRLGATLTAACSLNVIFVLMGVVTPSAFYLVIQAALLTWAATASGWFTTTRRITITATALAAAAAMTPFIATVHPSEVIHDPAIMLATLASLTAAGQGLTVLSERFG